MADMLAYEFFRNALLGGLLVSILCAMVGTYVVTRRMVIVGGGMAHASLGGVGLGAYLGFSPLLGAALFAVFSGYSIDFLSRRNVREDAAIAMLWTLGMSLGILFAYPHARLYDRFALLSFRQYPLHHARRSLAPAPARGCRRPVLRPPAYAHRHHSL